MESLSARASGAASGPTPNAPPGGGRLPVTVTRLPDLDPVMIDEGTLSYHPGPAAAPVWFQRLQNVIALYRRQVVPPRLQAALLRVLATTPGLVVLGRGHDRVGRAVVAVAFDSTPHSRPARYELLLDPRSGALRGLEEAVTTLRVNPQTGRDYLNVRIPSLVGSETYLASGHARDDRTHP